jgi:hypothetical protein
MKTETKKMYRPVLWRIVIALSTTNWLPMSIPEEYGLQLGTENWQHDEETIHQILEKANVVILCATIAR